VQLPGWLAGAVAPGSVVQAALAAYGTPSAQLGVASPFASADHLEHVTWADLLGAVDTLPVTRAEAMSVPAIARARHILCSTLGRTELRVHAAGQAGPLPVQPTVTAQPDPEVTRFATVVWTVDDLIFHGRSVWYVLERLAEGRPRHARRIDPGRITVDQRRGPNGLLRNVWEIDGVEVPSRDVLVIDGPHEGVLTFGARSIRLAASLERTAARVADNPTPVVELHATSDYPFTDAEVEALLAKWAEARRGERGGVAFTSQHVEAKLHGSPAEHLLTAGRNAAAVDAARLVSVPADAVDASPERASMTYANVESRNRTLIDYGLAAYAAALESRLSMDDVLPHGQVARFDLAELTRPSATAETPPGRPGPDPEVAP
jgi:hypothetical protein